MDDVRTTIEGYTINSPWGLQRVGFANFLISISGVINIIKSERSLSYINGLVCNSKSRTFNLNNFNLVYLGSRCNTTQLILFSRGIVVVGVYVVRI